MRAITCDQESRILKALASGRAADSEVQAHLASCEGCREAASVARFMGTMAETSGETRPLPDPALLWWKAQMLRRWEAERHVAAPIERMRLLEIVVGIAGVIVMIVWQWADLTRAFGSLNPAHLITVSSAANASPYLPAALVGAVLLGAGVLAGMHRALAEN